ncbi:MAG: ABC transporter permease, partial [Phycisphaerales bacterium]|nr:ABC transporter permease [Phycisphaerales bacterium]
MLRFAARRLLTLPLVLLAMYAAAVALIAATPGDPLDSGDRPLPPDVLAAKRVAYNYDQPWLIRYFWTWPRRLIWDGDLPAHQYEDWTVVEIMRTALPVSLQLGVLALPLALLIGVGAGALSVARRGSWVDHAALGISLIGISLPTFVVGSALMIVFGLWLRAAPVGGWGLPSQAFLPALTLALPHAAYIARLSRSSILE